MRLPLACRLELTATSSGGGRGYAAGIPLVYTSSDRGMCLVSGGITSLSRAELS